jgi:diguanylate cyclase (GGDEF)-like protein
VSPDRREMSAVSPDRREMSAVSPDRREMSAVSPDRRDLSLRYAPNVQVFDSDNGLPQNSVTAMLEDRRGYLWIGTFGGLSRFDGHRFRNFAGRGVYGLPSDRISALLEDAQGHIWVGTENAGIARYLGEDHFARAPGACQRACRVRQFLQSDKGDLYVVAVDGVFALGADLQLRAIAPEIVPPPLAAVNFQNQIYFANRERLFRWSANASEIPNQPAKGVALSLDANVQPGLEITKLFSNSDALLVATGRGLLSARMGKLVPAFANAPLDALAHYTLDREGNSWFGTSANGLWVAAKDAPPRPWPGGEKLVKSSVLQDRSGALWFGSDGQGLMRIEPAFIGALGGGLGGPTRANVHGSVDRNLSNWSVVGMAVLAGDPKLDPHGIWLGAYCDGLYRFEQGKSLMRLALPDDRNTCVWSLSSDLKGGAYVSHGAGFVSHFVRIETATGIEMRYQKSWRILDERLRALWAAPDGSLYAGGPSGLYRLANAQADAFERLHDKLGEIANIQPAHDGGLWLASDSGLLHRQSDGKTTHVTNLNTAFVRAVVEDERHALWLGTYGGGLQYIDGKRVRVFTERDGLAENFISCIVPDAFGRLWLSGNRGISVVSKAELEKSDKNHVSVRLYTKADGMPVSEANGGGSATCGVDQHQRIWFSLISGYAVIDPKTVPLASSKTGPRVEITDVRVNGESMDWRSGLHLDSTTRNLSLHYIAPNLGGKDDLEFRYRLGTDWIELGRSRELNLSALPWGNLRIDIASRMQGGVWGGELASILVHNQAPWYGRFGVWAGVLGSILGLGFYFFRSRTKWLTERAVALNRLVEERTQALWLANQQLEALASTDSLTGLGNRRHFTEHFMRLKERVQGTPQSLALVMFDVDYFKAYNDCYGHPAGDVCLEHIAMMVKRCVHSGVPERKPHADDLAARVGGEEFAVLMIDADENVALAWAENLRAQIEAMAEPHRSSPLGVVSISAGVSAAAGPGLNHVNLIEQADTALYDAKRLGRNQVSKAH